MGGVGGGGTRAGHDAGAAGGPRDGGPPATAELARYTRGHGRHVKDCVRIAIARLGWSTVFALPGPTHEVKLALPVLIDGLARKAGMAELVEAIAVPLRATLPAHRHHHH